jgi:putative ABC transport system ATP-binding protein
LENVMLPLELDGVSARSARRSAFEALALVGLEQNLDRFPDHFSGGQKQRIAIARAIVGDRRLLLADEPTGALDSTTSEQVIDLLDNLRKRSRTTVVLVTHSPRCASVTDRIVFLRDGKSVDVSNPELAQMFA